MRACCWGVHSASSSATTDPNWNACGIGHGSTLRRLHMHAGSSKASITINSWTTS